MKNKGLLLCFLLIFMGSINIVKAQDYNSKFAYKSQACGETTIPYRLFIPDNYDSTKKYPLILALHGGGERGTNNTTQLNSIILAKHWADTTIQKAHPCIIIAPQCPNETLWYSSGYETPVGDVLRAAISIIDTLAKQYSIDKDRLYLIGSSMGGVACWEVANNYPDKFAAIVPLFGDVPDRNTIRGILKLSIWLFSGSRDGVFPPSVYYGYIKNLMLLGRKVVFPQSRFGVYSSHDCMSKTALQDTINKGANLIFTEYPNFEHSEEITQAAYRDTLLTCWLFMQHLASVTSVKENESEIPRNYFLYPNYPNPFNPTTEIKYQVPCACHVAIKVYDITGREISTLINEYKEAGIYSCKFNGDNLTSGVYFYTLNAGGVYKSGKMLLLK
jgi:predicted esterase